MIAPHAPANAENIIGDDEVVAAITSFRAAKKSGMLTVPNRQGSELIESLKIAFPPEVIQAHIKACLAATVETRGGTVVTDNRTRLATLQLLVSYTEGRPIERQQVETLTHVADPDADLAARARKSPALRKMLRRVLDEAGG
jgi:hypothetical protein